MNYKNTEILIFRNIEQISDFVIKKWLEISEKAIEKRGQFSVALSGGNTPVALYQRLAGAGEISTWNRTHVFLVDERFVPFKDKESNYRMISRTLLSHIEIPGKNVHPVSTSENTPQDSAVKYEEDLRSFFKTKQGEFPGFDLILLGIGEDGHTASLFSDAPALNETERLAVAVSPPDKSGKERITLTFPVINNADNIFFLICGSNKAVVVDEILQKKNTELPASMVRPENGRMFFLIDKEAGSLLSEDTHAH